MLAYPIALEEDDGAVLATSSDFPELTTFGDDREEAVTRAVEALEEAIAARIHDRKDIPSPSPRRSLRHIADSDFCEGDAVSGHERPGHHQSGVGPTLGVASAAG